MYLKEPNQFSDTVAEMFNFLQSREVATTRILQLASPILNYSAMTVEKALQYGRRWLVFSGRGLPCRLTRHRRLRSLLISQ